jgi:hypothetical protein
VEYRKYEMAASLAEKYFDFEILIQLCDDTDNSERKITLSKNRERYCSITTVKLPCRETVKEIAQ